ncbi:hypothetical protein [Nocardia sp. NPDC050175]|uniref:hypothetical protein n=1 Tax=Nocardia sp. NPDC050175 TaxID=3364317 RepID=UPI00379A9A61
MTSSPAPNGNNQFRLVGEGVVSLVLTVTRTVLIRSMVMVDLAPPTCDRPDITQNPVIRQRVIRVNATLLRHRPHVILDRVRAALHAHGWTNDQGESAPDERKRASFWPNRFGGGVEAEAEKASVETFDCTTETGKSVGAASLPKQVVADRCRTM